ncbi:hypothetical protein [Variovorax boronicumulans]
MSGIPSRARTVLVFCVELAVFDEDALVHAAKARAREDGLSDEVWASMRSGMPDDLIMLLDPGLVADAGFEIIQSTCEVSEHAIDQR